MSLNDIFDSSFDAQLGQLMEEWQVPGVAISLVKGQDEHIIRCFGERDIGQPVTPKTMFLLASNSKFFTVSALHRALEQANIRDGFAATVKSVLPEFELVDKEAEVKCTFIDMLTHRTALPEHNMFLLRPLAPGEAIFDRLKHVHPLKKWEDREWSYNNNTYDICAIAVERLTGMSFEAYVQEELLDLWDMRSTTYQLERGPNDDVACGWQCRTDAEGYLPGLMRLDQDAWNGLGDIGIGCCRVRTNAEDLVRWMKHFPLSEAYKEASIGRYPHYDTSAAKYDDGSRLYGYGLSATEVNGVKTIGHTGALAGLRTLIARLPEHDITLGVLTNSTEGWDIASFVQSWLMGRVAGLSGLSADWVARIRVDRQTEIKRLVQQFNPIQGTGIESLIGQFTSPAYGTLTFDLVANVPKRPECTDLPWLPFLYGPIRPIVSSMGHDKWEGCFEWRGRARFLSGPSDVQGNAEEEEVLQSGLPFGVELRGDVLVVSPFGEWGGGKADNDPEITFSKV